MFLQSDVPVLVDLERFCVVIGQRCLEMDASLLLSSSAYSDYSDLYCMKTPWCDQNPVKWGLPGRYTRYTLDIPGSLTDFPVFFVGDGCPGMALAQWCGNLARKDMWAILKGGLPGKVLWREWWWPGSATGCNWSILMGYSHGPWIAPLPPSGMIFVDPHGWGMGMQLDVYGI